MVLHLLGEPLRHPLLGELQGITLHSTQGDRRDQAEHGPEQPLALGFLRLGGLRTLERHGSAVSAGATWIVVTWPR